MEFVHGKDDIYEMEKKNMFQTTNQINIDKWNTWWRTTHGSWLWVSSPQFFLWINPLLIPYKSLGL